MFKLCITNDIGFEFWKDIEGYEGLYQVSNYGNIKALGNGKTNSKERIMKLCKGSSGYLQVDLHQGGKHKTIAIHRLVAEAFLPHFDNLLQVNHRDEDKTNNRVENLEWCDCKYNNNYGSKNQRAAEKNTNGKRSKPVKQFSKEGELITTFPSTREIERQLGFSQANISKCCLCKCKQAYGFIWRYA